MYAQGLNAPSDAAPVAPEDRELAARFQARVDAEETHRAQRLDAGRLPHAR